MSFFRPLATSILLASQALSQSTPCPLAGAVYPVPSQLSQSDAFAKANATFNDELVRAFKSESIFGALTYNASFSINIYSLHEQESLLTHHFSGPELPSESGVKKVDSDTIYRLGSISKLFTTYVYLLNAGFEGWNDPITKYIPELQEYADKSKSNPIDVVAWDEVTVGSLVSHLAGITRDGAPPPSTDAMLAAAGLPEVPAVPGDFCGDPAVQEFPCDDENFLQNVLFRHPILPTFAATPIYSNAAWGLIAMALEKITDKSFSTLFEKTLVKSLDLTGTYDTTPPDESRAIVPVNSSASWYSADLRRFGPAGGHFSTINDLQKIGRSILNSTLLPESRTRQWMKPSAFTADPDMAVGAPWEIFKAPINRTSWMYTKSGDLGMYSNNMILLPEFDIGITILTAGPSGSIAGTTSRILSDIVTTSFMPAFEQGAKEEAVPVYAGVYTDAETNSTITLDILEDEPGLKVSEWSFGGVDVFPLLSQAMRAPYPVNVQMYPTGLDSPDGKQVAWRAILEIQRPKGAGLFSSFCSTWFSAEGVVYGGQSIGEFIFKLNDTTAEELDFRMLDIPLAKTSGTLSKKTFSDPTLLSLLE